MQIIDSLSDLRQARRDLMGRVGLVPTMGALHQGHMSLVDAARADNDSVIATIFVNPTQFAANEDLSAYPRDLDGDLAKFEAAGVDIVFTPTPAMMYPDGFQTYITVEQVTQGLEGAHRPGHFRGVTTIVSKLFNLTQPTTAYFGQKDAQQVVVIRRMVADLNFPLEIAVIPTQREADGLAMSSRNVYLTHAERQSATVLNRALVAAGEAYEQGERAPDVLLSVMQDVVTMDALAKPEYFSVADAVTLQELDVATHTPMLLSLTVQIGKPRLLDNRLLPIALNTREGLTATLGNVAAY
ncbi:MAG: pantoate--beta-alanine ligase [Aggregatilineales bacterium]